MPGRANRQELCDTLDKTENNQLKDFQVVPFLNRFGIARSEISSESGIFASTLVSAISLGQ